MNLFHSDCEVEVVGMGCSLDNVFIVLISSLIILFIFLMNKKKEITHTQNLGEFEELFRID